MEHSKEVIILIVEDDEGHADLIQEGLQDGGVRNKIIHFPDGEKAWNFLCNPETSKLAEKKVTYLILLDINMPIMDGIEVLTNLKAHDDLKELPVIMLTTTDDPREVEECYRLGCNFYITKPVDFMKFTDILKKLGFFIQIVRI